MRFLDPTCTGFKGFPLRSKEMGFAEFADVDGCSIRGAPFDWTCPVGRDQSEKKEGALGLTAFDTCLRAEGAARGGESSVSEACSVSCQARSSSDPLRLRVVPGSRSNVACDPDKLNAAYAEQESIHVRDTGNETTNLAVIW